MGWVLPPFKSSVMARLVDINYPANVIHEGVKREFKLIPPLSKNR